MRWWVLGWLLAGGIINYFDRANLSLATPQMMKELDLSAADIGLMASVFSWTYAVMQLPAGHLIDRLGSRRVYTVAVTLWSVATLATGLCYRLPQFLAARLVLGVGEAPCFPASAKITSKWFPKRERGTATGIWDSSSKWGPALAPLLLVPVMVHWGWRALFVVTGVLGLIFVIAFWIGYRDPSGSRRLSAEERELIEADQQDAPAESTSESESVSWPQLFTQRTVWGMILGFFCTIWIWNIFLAFLPLYLVRTQGIDLAKLGLYASIPWLGGVVGDVGGGFLTTRLVARGVGSPLKVRRMLILACALLAGLSVVLVPSAHGLAPTLLLLTLALCFVSAITGSAWAMPGDVAPQHQVASVGAIQNFGGYFGGAFSPLVAGLIVDRTDSWSLAFYSGGVVAALAGLCYWFIVRRPITGSATT
ncbi:MFS transporter [Actinopolymorpha rutila]|uniref:MFS family permease n=1 Tax=Actinopolymorpha rutila TaxID=446787 RepID=A0A852ZDX7_9ACTN|nr:MFS transporter [Actinopolymorpha rutila]NYH91381.1 MFS family permease [Actinopolymorpha rutila]